MPFLSSCIPHLQRYLAVVHYKCFYTVVNTCKQTENGTERNFYWDVWCFRLLSAAPLESAWFSFLIIFTLWSLRSPCGFITDRWACEECSLTDCYQVSEWRSRLIWCSDRRWYGCTVAGNKHPNPHWRLNVTFQQKKKDFSVSWYCSVETWRQTWRRLKRFLSSKKKKKTDANTHRVYKKGITLELTNSRWGSWVKTVITETAQQRRLANTGVSHQDNLKETVWTRACSFPLNKRAEQLLQMQLIPQCC